MRTLTDVNRDLLSAVNDAEQAARLDAMLTDLQEQQNKCQQVMEQARLTLSKEEKDVRAMEGLSFSAFVARLRGDLEERTAQEKREAAAAKARFDAAVRDLEDISARLEKLRAQRAAPGNFQDRYQSLLAEKEAILLSGMEADPSDPTAERLRYLQFRLREVGEALSAGENALSALNEMYRELDDASDWGACDMFGGGLLATMAKHDHLDAARHCADRARSALSRFRTEMADVSKQHVPDVEIGEFATFADYFFDGFFSDMMVQDKISAARTQTGNTIRGIELLLLQLDAEAHRLSDEREKLLRKGSGAPL